ncbi:hypothetical protein [Bradyrhizobium erythrophlei]|jgi:hypothetical protein|nr:hypothetical protein [Bradyrhizobium erythrophlei]
MTEFVAAVIVREKRAIQYAEPFRFFYKPLEYWMPLAFAGHDTEF